MSQGRRRRPVPGSRWGRRRKGRAAGPGPGPIPLPALSLHRASVEGRGTEPCWEPRCVVLLAFTVRGRKLGFSAAFVVRNRVSDQVLFAQAKNNLTLRAGKGLKDELKSDGNYSAVEIVLMMVPVSFFFF